MLVRMPKERLEKEIIKTEKEIIEMKKINYPTMNEMAICDTLEYWLKSYKETLDYLNKGGII